MSEEGKGWSSSKGVTEASYRGKVDNSFRQRKRGKWLGWKGQSLGGGGWVMRAAEKEVPWALHHSEEKKGSSVVGKRKVYQYPEENKVGD